MSNLDYIAEPLREHAVPVDSVSQDPSNVREHPEKNKEAVKSSLREFGQRQVLVARQEQRTIEAGNLRLECARELGWSHVAVIFVDDDELQAARYAIADNRTTDLGEWNEGDLGDMLEALDDPPPGYTDDDVGELLDDLDGDSESLANEVPDADEDRAGELLEKWGVKRGQVWRVAEHTIACGDSTDLELLNSLFGESSPDLVLADPPYGIDVVQGDQVEGGGELSFGSVGGEQIVDSSTYREVKNDDSTDTAHEFYAACKEAGCERLILWGGNYFTDFLPPSSCWIVWDKDNTGNFADVELAWCSDDSAAKLYEWMWNGLARKGSRELEGVKRFHPTQKPVGLHIEILQDFSESRDVVFDGFLGAGTTALACKQAQRRCIGIEYEPAYVAVTLERFSEMGLEPELVD